MKSLKNKRILLGVSGGIAAYKSADLCRRLAEHGCDVRVVMTAGAQEFIQPLTFQALTGNPVHTELLDPKAEAAMGHIELARWADAIIIAPATADIIAKLATGTADDLLSTLCLASRLPLAIAPAMNQQMWASAATQDNIARLRQRDVLIWGPGSGEQACGDVGAGRMLEPLEIAERANALFASGRLAGLRVMITAGPTQENIDPVRYLTNHSSGKMGFAMAQAAVEAGAVVTLISGPVNLPTPEGLERLNVISAQQMYDAVLPRVPDCDIFIATAAVADYRMSKREEHKIKKHADELVITLHKNPDILSAVATHERAPFAVGFAAETQNIEAYAMDKLHKKNLRLICANRVHGDSNTGFNADTNEIHAYWEHGKQHFPSMPKSKLARELIQLVSEHFDESPRHEKPST
ncbi:MAG: bifunctional phosphopantothenoylcysteine decarboxylase/phosphopantothenate--cysteine ligase CoaBC [Gammaproteobacteria bacterium]|nr:MAG: bifunctional phosphopantothenoylcysteine decarboxylase/phosphopantothenate--cysteine ligase CoaBC [Gammaproteobacteria bacterium]